MNSHITDRSLPLEPEVVLPPAGANGLQPVENQAVANNLAYWKRHLTGAPVLSLPIGNATRNRSERLAVRTARAGKILSDSLRRLSQNDQMPLWAVLLSAFQVLIFRCTSQDDLVIACSLSGLPAQSSDSGGDDEKDFVLRIDVSDDPPFGTLLARVHSAVLESLAHTYCPLSELLQTIKVLDAGNLQVGFAWKSLPDASNRRAESFPLGLRLEIDDGEELQLRLIYDPQQFMADSMDRILIHCQSLLKGLVDTPEKNLSSLPMLTETEQQQILVEWNQTARDYPRQHCLHNLIEDWAASRPEKTAVIDGDRELSYSEFNARANQLAHCLQSRGVGPDQRVAICLHPSREFAIAVLGVLKAGAACVPLDPTYPKDRLAFMLHDVQARVVITERGVLAEGAPAGCEMFFLAENDQLLSSQPHGNLHSSATPADIAYVIYTSGSTGKPRGVLLTHAGLVNYNTNAARMYSMTPDDRVLQFCSLSFDIAVEELFITWLTGATLVLRTVDMPLAVSEFLDWVERRAITVLDLPTAYWHEWVHELPQLRRPVPRGLRLVIVGGEKPSSQAYAKWLAAVGKSVRWINTYGPTEISICATAFEPDFHSAVEVPDNIPIGRPLANTRVYLLDRHLSPVPVGVAGELCVAGVGVARGYLNRPELTAEKFIPDPYSRAPGARLYRTGDLARYLPSGDIEFLGRKDDQVKIRGFRVELGEIVAVLGKHSGIRDATVIVCEPVPDDKQLVAYFVAAGDAKPSAAELRHYLRGQLPDYMVPSAFVALDAMPLTPNGKVNKRELPPAQIQSSPDTSAPVQNTLQAQLVKIWQDVLGRKPIGVRDNFFELGGHSILAARLMDRTGRVLGKTLPLAMLFHAPTIEELAVVLSEDEWARHWSSLVPIQPAGSQPPFFCIHGVGGNVVGFHQLGRHMGPDYPFYGLQSPGLDGQQALLTSVEAMASHYITEMRSVQPRGPYFLGGFSFGGLVGYEVAQQLRSMGEEAALLALFDTYPGSTNFGSGSFLRVLLNPSRQSWLHDMPRAIEKKLRRTWRNLRVSKALWDVHNANRAAASRYVLRPYPGEVTLIRATQKPWEDATDPHAAWNSLAGGLTVHEIAADHYDILLEPQVGQLAERLKTWIDRARAHYVKAPDKIARVIPPQELELADTIQAEDDRSS